MLGTCNACVRLQFRATSSGATVDGLFLFACLFVYLFVCLFVLVTLFAFILFLFLFNFFFSRIFGMGVEVLIRKILGFVEGAGYYNRCRPE